MDLGYTLEEKSVYPRRVEAIATSYGGYTEKAVLDRVLSSVPKQCADASPRPSNANRHSDLMATLHHKNPHLSRSVTIVPPNDAKCRHYSTERQRIMVQWRHIGI